MLPINTADPLGLALKARARDAQWQRVLAGLQDANTSLTGATGPLYNNDWDAFQQAESEASKKPGADIKYGYSSNPKADLSRDPAWAAEVQNDMPLSMQGLYKSSQLGTPIDRMGRMK